MRTLLQLSWKTGDVKTVLEILRRNRFASFRNPEYVMSSVTTVLSNISNHHQQPMRVINDCPDASTKNCRAANEKKVERTMAIKNLKKLLRPLINLVKRKQLLQREQQEQQSHSQCNYENERQEEQQKTLAEIQQNAYNASLEDMRRDAASLHAAVDNFANEQLEQQLQQDLQQQQQQQQQQQLRVIVHCGCHAQPQQSQQSHLDWVVPIARRTFGDFLQDSSQQQYCIPVHFTRTNNGTFFWTTRNELRHHEWLLRAQYDRWGQA